METNNMNKKVIIFGGASGIGAACVEYFTHTGAEVFCIDKNKEKLSEISKKYEVTVIECDVVNENLATALTDVNEIDIAINCVGIYSRADSITDFSPKVIMDTMNTNLISAIYISQFVAPFLIKSRGSMVHVSSSLALLPEKESPVYCASKAGLNMFVKCLALELADEGVRVNSVCPGPIDTPLLDDAFPDKKILKEYVESRPLKRAGKPEEVASLIGFLSSHEATYITGGIYPVDGGESLM